MARRKKAEETPLEPKVVDLALEEILADRFSRYSRYIIQERALPDARDGLKPVQRRILWAMEEDGNTSTKPYRKSAKTVGNVIGNYHPHGDTSVYDAIVRMSQDWKSVLPLIDMQGNNGSIDDDPAAAMRYTEARLSKIADYLMEDIDKETVDWSPNFSDEKLEPTVLPARFPNLLVHGISGIAAGYATSIPPHNFNEVLAAAIYRIDHPDCAIEELLEIVQGPDFPTGGIIMGREGIEQALRTGKGRVTVRSKAEIEEGRTINRIVITEIPYEVVKSALVRRIDELRLNGQIAGLLDVRDESGRNGLRIVCDLKKESSAQAILNYLYKNTDLQTYYHYNVIAIVNHTPRQLSLADALDAFVGHREQVVIKRSRFELDKANKRMHIVDGLIHALDVLDEVIRLIRASKGKADARDSIACAFGFTQEQAEAIVTLQLYRLSNTDIQALKAERTALEKTIRWLETILKNEKKRRELMKKELQTLSNEFVMPRRTHIEAASGDVSVDLRQMIPDERVMVTATRQGYLNRVSLRSAGSSKGAPTGRKDDDDLLLCQEMSTLDTLLVITDQGRVGQASVYQLEEKKWKDIGTHYSSVLKAAPGEQIAAVLIAQQDPTGSDLLLATRCGYMRRIPADQLPLSRTPGRLSAMMKIADQDALVDAIVSPRPDDQLLLISRQGVGLRLNTADIPQSSGKGKGRGVIAMNLAASDSLLGMALAGSEFLLLENEQGQMRKIAAGDIEARRRPAKGVRLYRQKKTSPVLVRDFLPVDARQTFCFACAPEAGQSPGRWSRQVLDGSFTPSGALEQPSDFLWPAPYLQGGNRPAGAEETLEEEQLSLEL